MTTIVGQKAEKLAAEHIERMGYIVLERNWHTRVCEIDIVAKKAACIYFIEVKYRERTTQGLGLDYITAKKLHQMQFAAEVWIQHHHWQGDYQLGAIEVSGPAFQVTAFITDLF